MDQRLTHLLARLRERFPADADVAEVEAFLSAEGYDRRQIGEILAILFADLPATGALADQARVPTTFRVPGPHERGRFAPDAWGHLLGLLGAGLVGQTELEYLIDRALLQLDGRISLDELRSLMETVGYEDGGGAADPTTVH